MLWSYVLVVIGTIVASWFVYLLWMGALMLGRDLQSQYGVELERQTVEVQRCRDDYYLNKCEPGQRREALEDFCQEREICMNTPPGATKTINILCQLLASAINSFVGTLSPTSLVVFFVVLFLGFRCLYKLLSAQTWSKDRRVKSRSKNPTEIKISFESKIGGASSESVPLNLSIRRPRQATPGKPLAAAKY